MNFKEGKILYFDKPLNWTSFDLVNRVRNLITKYSGEKIKVGHAGTLDPLATGVMILATGKATKCIEKLQSTEKEYIATLKFGETTPSFDLEHAVDKTFPFEHITREMAEKKLKNFVGEIWQIPPVFSAVKIDGKRAYKYARKGKEVELKAKQLVIKDIDILDFSLPFLKIRVVCSKGTYIRALARDIGEALDSGAHLTALQRTRVGDVTLCKCFSINDFELIFSSQKDFS
jgi:tRNA pseudouridine55 synthase